MWICFVIVVIGWMILFNMGDICKTDWLYATHSLTISSEKSRLASKKTIQFRSRSLCIPDNEYLIELHTIYHTMYTTKDGNKTWRARLKVMCWSQIVPRNQLLKLRPSLQLKVSKFRKQIILSSHVPKNQRNFSHFLP